MLIIIVICLICQATVTSPTWTFDWVVLQILVTIEGRGQRNVNHSRGSGHGRGPYIDHGLSSGNSSNPSSCFRGLFLAGPRPDLHYKHEMVVAPWKQLNLVIRKSQVISTKSFDTQNFEKSLLPRTITTKRKLEFNKKLHIN